MTTENKSTAQMIGVVTVLYNSDEVLDGFFASLALQSDVIFRLYVIDNSATSSGLDLARVLTKRYNIKAELIFNNANVGVARGNNQGIEMALADGCKLVLLANNDVEFGATTLRRLHDALEGGIEQVATPKIMFFDDPEKIWYGGGYINTWKMGTPHYGMRERDIGQLDHQTYVDYAPTCFMLIHASVFADVGRMDEKYFAYFDDTDFVWRMAARGIRIRFVSNAVVLHKVSFSTGGSNSPFSLYYTNRNRVYFIRKNLRGARKLVAMAYVLGTRCLRAMALPAPSLERVWSGVRDGFLLGVASDNSKHRADEA
jgi:GT2 family glycosyltransferase